METKEKLKKPTGKSDDPIHTVVTLNGIGETSSIKQPDDDAKWEEVWRDLFTGDPLYNGKGGKYYARM